MSQQQSQNKVSQETIQWDLVETYLRSQNLVLNDSRLEVQQFTAGYSNLTYFIQMGEWKGVLRRPPFGPIPPKAHDMKREHDLLEKVNKVFPLAPKPYLYCEDESIMDRHFYVMEKKDGFVIDDLLPEEFQSIPSAGQSISKAAVETLVKLHEIDYQQAGLESLGYPDGYLSRQVHGWIKRYNHAKTDDINGVDAIEKWLVEHIPTSPAPTIVHNDFKLNNLMYSADDPSQVIGVFDWELSTIGDPLTDVGAMIAYWEEEGDPFTGIVSATRNPGFASRKELLEMYAKRSGRDLSEFDFYLAFAFYKIGAILQQIYYRWKIGETKDKRFARLGEGVANLMTLAERAMRKEILR